MQVFAKKIAELFTIDYPSEIKPAIACRLACKRVGASSVSIFMYSGKEDKLICKGRYIDPEAGKIQIEDNRALLQIVQNIGVYEYLYASKNEVGVTSEESLFQGYLTNTFRQKDISREEFKKLIAGFDEWEKDYLEYKSELGKESYLINTDTITGNFYRELVKKSGKDLADIPIEDLKKVDPNKKQRCLTYLQKKLGLFFNAEYYIALPLFANNRYFGILRFLFPKKMPFILSKNNSLHLDDEYKERLKYLAQIMSLHLESNYYSEGYKKTYLSSRKPMGKKSLSDFLDEQCKALSIIIESRGAIIRRWNPQRKHYQIMGYSRILKEYIDYEAAFSPDQAFFELISVKFEKEPNILGIHYDCRDTPLNIKKYIHYDHIATPWHTSVTWDIPDLEDHTIFHKLKDLGFFNIAILPVPGISKCFIIFLNNENRRFTKEDIKMIYPAIRNLGLEWEAFDYEKKKIEKRMNVISGLHERTSELFLTQERKAFEYTRNFLEILGETIKNFEIFTHHLIWLHVTEIVPQPSMEEKGYYLRNITLAKQAPLPFKNKDDIPGNREIHKLAYSKKKFSQKILKYFRHEKLARIFNFDLLEDYDYFDLLFYAESEEVNQDPTLVGIITLFYKKEDDNIIKNIDFFRFMRFLSKQVDMAWKNLQENIAFQVQEKIDNLTSSDDKENHNANNASLNKIAEILASEFNCELCCVFLTDQNGQYLKLEGSNIPIGKPITHRLSEKNVLSVISFNQNRNFRILRRERIEEIVNIDKIRMIEAEIKETALKKFYSRRGGPYDDICIENWLSVVINIGKEKLGLIKLLRIKGLKKSGAASESSYYPPPFSEFETNLLNRIQKHIFNLILSHQAIQKRMEDMRNVLHQVISPLNALIGHSTNIAEGIIPEDKIPEKLEYINILSKTATNYARNFQKVLDIDTGNIVLKKEKIADLNQYLRDFARDYQPFLKGKKIQIHVTGQTKKDIVLRVDKELFDHVIRNLLDNAVKYSLSAEERHKIGLQYHPKNPGDKENVLVSSFEGSGNVVIEISNWGHAMPEKERKNVFKREFRGIKARDQAPVGAGIGLYMVKKIIDLHSGSVELSPTGHPNHFVFKIRLPKGEKHE
jgi:signal transduction histidine kinase